MFRRRIDVRNDQGRRFVVRESSQCGNRSSQIFPLSQKAGKIIKVVSILQVTDKIDSVFDLKRILVCQNVCETILKKFRATGKFENGTIFQTTLRIELFVQDMFGSFLFEL